MSNEDDGVRHIHLCYTMQLFRQFDQDKRKSGLRSWEAFFLGQRSTIQAQADEIKSLKEELAALKGAE